MAPRLLAPSSTASSIFGARPAVLTERSRFTPSTRESAASRFTYDQHGTYLSELLYNLRAG